MRPVREAATRIRTALAGREPAPAGNGLPEHWRVTGAAGEEDARTIDAADLETVLRGIAS